MGSIPLLGLTMNSADHAHIGHTRPHIEGIGQCEIVRPNRIDYVRMAISRIID
jgi:hypothetical protein